jgi:hypothetical protein
METRLWAGRQDTLTSNPPEGIVVIFDFLHSVVVVVEDANLQRRGAMSFGECFLRF